MPATYRDILDLFDAQKATNNYQSLPEYAASLNDLTGTQNFDAGLKDSWVKRASVGLDRAIESTGAPDALGSFFGDIGGSFGYRDAGESAGRALPRGIVNFAPMMVAAALTGGGSAIAQGAAGLLGAGATALSSGLTGAEAYTSTGSPLAGLLSGAALPIAGVAAHLGGQLALKAIGAPLLEGVAKPLSRIVSEGLLPAFTPEVQTAIQQVGGRVAETLGQRVASYLGGQTAALSVFEAANEATSVVTGQGLYNPLEPEKLFGTLIGQLPFAALDIPRVAKATPAVDSMRRFLTTEVKNKDASDSLVNIPRRPDASTEDGGQLVKKLYDILKAKKVVDEDTTLTEEQKNAKIDELMNAVGKVSESTQGTGLEGKGYDEYLNSVVEAHKAVEVKAPELQTEEDRVRLRGLGYTEQDIQKIHEHQQEQASAKETVAKVESMEPPKDLNEVLSQVDEVAKAGVDSGAATTSVETLKTNLNKVEEVATNFDDAIVKALQVEKNKIINAAGLQLGSTASVVAKETRFVQRSQDFANRESLARTKHPLAQQYREDLDVFNQFLLTNDEKIGAGKKEANSLSRNMLNAFYNWEEGGREGGYERLKSILGTTKQNLRKPGVIARPTVKMNGSISSDRGVRAMRFNKLTEAEQYIADKKLKDVSTALRSNEAKTKTWYVLEATKRAPKETSLFTEQGQEKNVVHDNLDLSDQENNIAHDDVAEVVGEINDTAGEVDAGPITDVVWDGVIATARNLDDEVIHGEMMHKFEGDVEETPTEEFQKIRDRLGAVLELVRAKGDQATKDKGNLEALNSRLGQSKFDSFDELQEFMRDSGTVSLLGEATKKLVAHMRALPSDPHGGWSSIDTSVGSSENGSFKGLKDLTPEQQNIVDQYQLTGEHAMGPLAAVAKSDKGLLGTLARALSASFGDRLKEVKLANLRIRDGQFFTRAEYDPGLDTILYGRDLLPVGPATRFDINYLNEIIVHETLHALTHDAIRNSPEEKANLDALRMKVVGLLPKEIRAIYEQSQAEGRYKQYQADRSVRMYELTPKQLQWHGILYALENTDEFISQSFSSSHMQEFLRKQAPTRKGNLFSTFVNYVKGLLNLYHVDDSLFHDVIAATDRLLNPQLRKPFESETILNGVMGKFGLAPKQLEERVGTAKSVLSLLTHVSNRIQDQAGYREILNGTIADAFLTAHEKGLLEPEDVRKLNTAQSWYDNLDESNQKIVNGLFQVEGKDEVKTVADILHSTIQRLGNPEKRDKFIRDLFYVDEPIKDAVSSLRRYTTTVTSSVNEVMVGAKKGLVNEVTDSPGISHVKDLYGAMLDLLTAEKRLKANADRFAELNKVSPEGFRVAQVDASNAPSPAPRDENQRTIAEEMGIVKPSFMSRTFEPLAQLAEKYPIMRDALYKVFKHQGDVREAVRRALLPFAGEFGANGEVTLSKAKLQKAYEVAQSVEMNRAVSDIRRKMNEGKMAFDPQAAEFQDTLNGLSANQRPRVIDFVNQMTQSMKVMQDTILARQSELGTISLAQIIQSRQPELRVGQSMTLAKTMNQALQMMDVPETVGQGQAILSSVQGRLSPEVLQETLKFAVEDKMRLKGLQGFYASRPWFSTEQRFKRYLLTMVDSDGDNHTSDYDNERQAAQAKRRLEGQGFSFTSVVDRKGNDNHPSFNQDAMIDEVRKLNERRLGQISQMMSGEPELLDQIRGYLKIDEDLTRSKIAKGLTEKGSQQQLKGGREELNMIQGHVSYINQVVNNQTAKVTRAGMTLSLMDGELKAQPELTKIAKQALDHYMHPDTEAGRALTRANFLYFMGMNPSTMLMEMGQSSLSLIPTMINEGMSIQKAYSATIATAAEIAKYGLTGKWNNPEHELVMNRAGARGDIMLSGLGDVMDDNAHASIGLSQLATGEEPTTVSSLVKKPLAMYEKLATGIYSKFPAFNARMALLTSFDHFRSQGMDFEEAFANAERINNVANFAGGRAARPVGFFNPKGEAGRTASMAFYSLQSYTTGMISMMGRYMMRGFGDLGKDLNPRDRANAKKAAVIMFGTQLAAAGALGLPGIGAGIALLEQIFPNLELNKAIRENLAKLGGDDKELGAFISDTALRGLPNQLGGVDVGSRLSLGNNVMGLSSYDGFDVANILGPSFNLFKNMAVGVSQAAQGEVSQAAQTILPPAYKKIIQLSQGGGDIRDNSGKLLLQPSMGEKFSMLLGFQPKALSDLKDAKRIESRSQEIGRRETIQFNSQVADALQAGDQVGLKSLLSTKLKEDNTFDPRSAIRAGAALVEQRTLPLDLARTSKSPDLLSTYQIASKPVSEVQRLQLRKQVESSTGIPGVGRMTSHDIQQAQQIDQLMAKGMTRDEARAKIESLTPSSTKLALPSF